MIKPTTKQSVFMLWHGGQSYPALSINSPEEFDSLTDARQAFEKRPGDPQYPRVSCAPPDLGGPCGLVYFAKPDRVAMPDRIIEFTLAGSARVVRA